MIAAKTTTNKKQNERSNEQEKNKLQPKMERANNYISVK